MLESLYIENFAIIKKLNISFDSGMTVLTGETGAGKSIIIDAINQLCGGRTDTGLIRDGAQKAVIEGIFSTQSDAVRNFFVDHDLEYDNQIVISKTIDRSSKTTFKLNYRNTTQTLIRKLAGYLIEIHNQFDNQFLFNPKNHLAIIDNLVKDKDLVKRGYQDKYQEYTRLKRQLDELQAQEYSDEQLDFYKTRLDKIEEIDIDHLDIDDLLMQKQRSDNFSKISENFEQFSYQIQNGLNSINDSLSYLAELNNLEKFDDEYDNIYNCLYTMEDNATRISSRIQSYDFDEYAITDIQDKISKFNHLKKIYGPTREAIIAARDDLVNKIEAFSNRDFKIAQLEATIGKLEKELKDLARQISKQRADASKVFEKNIKKELNDLYLNNVKFKVSFKEIPLTKDGFDQVEFLISTNVGVNLQSLIKVASGGEISRVMLAIKAITLNQSPVQTIIFDEADTGVSGKVGAAIGRKMARLSQNCQVIVITHLFQVALYTNHHLLIKKQVEDASTRVTISDLDFDGQVEELAKLISSENLSPESLEHARNYLVQAQKELLCE